MSIHSSTLLYEAHVLAKNLSLAAGSAAGHREAGLCRPRPSSAAKRRAAYGRGDRCRDGSHGAEVGVFSLSLWIRRSGETWSRSRFSANMVLARRSGGAADAQPVGLAARRLPLSLLDLEGRDFILCLSRLFGPARACSGRAD